MPSSSFYQRLALVFGLATAPYCLADDIPAATRSALTANLAQILPGETVTDIRQSPVAGLYQVTLPGGQFLFMSPDGEYVLAGELYQISAAGVESLTENQRKVTRQAQLADIAPADMIAFAPKGKPKAVLYVFTDVDCGYCQKLHQEVPQLTEKGVEVRYLAFPRGGLASVGYAKIATAWCAKNPQQALTDLKNGKKLPLNVCENNPVAKEYALGNDMGVQGTPALLLADGTLIPGYRPAAELLEILGLN